MPELLEVEQYRRLAEQAVGRRIVDVVAPDPWYLKGGLDADGVRVALVGERVAAARRRGKLLLLDTDGGATLGLRFGMTGRLLLDGNAAIERLEYSSGRDETAWDRFTLRFRQGGELRVRDPRRLGAVELQPDEEALGPDATTVTRRQLVGILQSDAPVKARLMDQRRLAGLGNLLTDEILWRSGIDPARRARALDPAELVRLHRHLRSTLRQLDRRGGSHTGDLQSQRMRDGVCPRDGAPLSRRTIGGRTTYSCPRHQV
jgi:formamidopyrimidine-DNA glycosylase